MAIAAPITAVCAVTVPVAVSIALGERPGAGTLAGIALALASIVLVSQQKTPEDAVAQDETSVAQGFSPVARASSMAMALASGVAIGLFFLALARTRADAGMWPLVAARGVSFSLFAAFALVTRRSLRMSGELSRQAQAPRAAGGVLDTLAQASAVR